MLAQLVLPFSPPGRGRRGIVRAVVVALLAAAFFSGARSAYAASITVDGTNCTLAEAIDSANADNAHSNGCTDGSGADILSLTSNVTLDAALPAIDSDMTIQGNFTVQRSNTAPSAFRIFTVNKGKVTFQNLTIKNGQDVGGAGADNYDDGGGGGLGAGGGLYIDDGTVLVQNVTFDHNNATGGAGGTDNSADTGGGKGGGSTNKPDAGGLPGQAGGFGGGGGGADPNATPSTAGNGGFGGGAGASNGIGGFGGGNSEPNGYGYGGGGGAGLGGALFIRKGTLTLISNSFTNNSATGGQGGKNTADSYQADNGQGIGGAIFICTTEDTLCGAIVSGSGNTFSGNSADDSNYANLYGTKHKPEALQSTASLQPTSQLTQQPYVQSCATGTNGYAKNCTLKFPLKNTSGGQVQIRYEQITSISSHVFVLNGAPSPGQTNAVVNDAQDLANNASFNATFNLGLTSSTTYSVKFKVYGYTGSVVAAGADQAAAVELGEYEVTLTPDAAGNVKLFLPVVNR